MSSTDLAGIMSLVRRPRRRRAIAALAAGCVVVTGLAWGILSLAWPVTPIYVHVRWTPDVTDAQRVELERRLQLTGSEHHEGTTWTYRLADASHANIRAVVQDEQVDDTAHLNRIRYRPEFAQDRARQIAVYSVAIGVIGSVVFLLLAPGYRRPASRGDSWSSAFTADPGLMVPASHNRRATAAILLAGVLASAAMTWLAGAPLWSAAAALTVVYAGGYVVGSLLVNRVEALSLAVIRTIAGLLLTTVGFLLSLVLSLPWFVLPGALIATAALLRGTRALSWPHQAVRFHWDGVAAGIVVVILLSPIAITFFYMAPGSVPPVFYNVDTAYSLEKVHALVAADTYPPPSLSNVGVRRTYHYGTQALAALISRSSGLLPHHSLFLIVLPLLAAGVVAAAVAVARYVAPALPRSVTVPLLLISVPSLSKSFWGGLWAAATSDGFSIDRFVGDAAVWGIVSNTAQNVGGDFLILGSVAGMAAARSWGWWVPVFLIGSSILFKTTTGIALVAGFALAEAGQAVIAKRVRPSPQMLMAAAVFIATFAAFFLVSFESVFRAEAYPLLHLRELVGPEGLRGFVLNVLWLFLPVLIVLTAGIKDPEKRSVPLLLMAIAPLLVLNTTRLDNTGTGGGGAGDDWVQILHPVPFLVHAFALSLASRRWDRLGRRRRAAVLLAMVLAVVPVATAAGRYSFRLLGDPASGHEFVDNRPLAEALAAIPTKESIIVTNDLRYPAENFARADRQMQIPALFGHQAFSANFSYEPVEERRELQLLLQRPDWSEAISEAARTHLWTHLVIRKDYVHPAPIPLEQIFENDLYAVFRFP